MMVNSSTGTHVTVAISNAPDEGFHLQTKALRALCFFMCAFLVSL